MNDKEYLNQIAGEVRKPKVDVAGGRLPFKITPKMLIFAGIGVFIIMFMMLLSSLLSGGVDKEKVAMEKLSIRTEGLIEVIQDYNSKIKSSELRSMGGNLASVLSETNLVTNNLWTENYSEKAASDDKEVAAEEEENIKALEASLEAGRLSGRLDRYYARELALQIALVSSLESEVIERTKYPDVATRIEELRGKLRVIQDQFDAYGDVNN